MRYTTAVNFTQACDDPQIIERIQALGANIEYHTERTLTFVLNGARMMLSHNWDDERYVKAITFGHPESKSLEQQVKAVVES